MNDERIKLLQSTYRQLHKLYATKRKRREKLSEELSQVNRDIQSLSDRLGKIEYELKLLGSKHIK